MARTLTGPTESHKTLRPGKVIAPPRLGFGVGKYRYVFYIYIIYA